MVAFIFSCTRLEPPPPRVAYRDFVSDFDSALLSDVQVIDFGTKKSLHYLLDGWGPPENSEQGTYAWAIGKTSGFRIWSNKPADIEMGFRAKAFAFPGAPEQVVGVVVNGKKTASFALGGDFSTPVVTIPAAALHGGENVVTLDFSYAKAPADVLPGSADDRPLAAYFDVAFLYADEEAIKRFMEKGIVAGKFPINGNNVSAIAMPSGAGVRFPNVQIAQNTILSFKLWREGTGSGSGNSYAEVMFLPEGETLFRPLFLKQIPPDMQTPFVAEVDLYEIYGKRGDLVFHIEPEGSGDSSAHLLVEPRLIARRPNVVLIVADALRADRLSCYGGPVQTPNICSLANEGVLFENAFSHYPGTPPSFSTIFTGRLPPSHGVRTMAGALSTSELTVAEALDGYFYNRGGFPALNILPQNMGFGQGFTQYDMSKMKGWRRDAGEVNADAIPWMREHSADGFFAFVHYADSHGPYAAPGSFELNISGALGGKVVFNEKISRPGAADFAFDAPVGTHEISIEVSFPAHCPVQESGEGHPVALSLIGDDAKKYLSPEDYKRLSGNVWLEPGKPLKLAINNQGAENAKVTLGFFVDVLGGGQDGCPGGDLMLAYDREVAYLDAQIGRLIESQKVQGIYDKTVLIFTADHGEAFSEHDLRGHINGLYDEFLHVPLIVRAPWIFQKGKRVSAPAGLMDIAPTIMDILDLPALENADGMSLVELYKRKKGRPMFAETVTNDTGEHLMSLRTREWKLIRSEDGKRVELFNLEDDPGERRNIVAAHPDKVRILTKELDSILKGRSSVRGGEIPDEVKARLRAMGYIK